MRTWTTSSRSFAYDTRLRANIGRRFMAFSTSYNSIIRPSGLLNGSTFSPPWSRSSSTLMLPRSQHRASLFRSYLRGGDEHESAYPRRNNDPHPSCAHNCAASGRIPTTIPVVPGPQEASTELSEAGTSRREAVKGINTHNRIFEYCGIASGEMQQPQNY
jgi:hypothetical protein